MLVRCRMQNADRSYAERLRRMKGKIYASGTPYTPITDNSSDNMIIKIESQIPVRQQNPDGSVIEVSCCGGSGPTPGSPTTVYSANGSPDCAPFKVLEGSTANDAFVVNYDVNGQAVWAARILGLGGADALSTASDSASNCYVAGLYKSASISIYNKDDTIFGSLTGTTNTDIFLIKYNSAGFAQWATRIAGVGDRVNVVDIASTSAGDVFVSGLFRSTSITIYNSNGLSAGTLANNAVSNGFLLKYDTNGTLSWKAGFTLSDPTANTSGEGIVVSSDNTAVYVTGAYGANLTFGSTGAPITLAKIAGAPSNGFVVKYNMSGVPQWAAAIAGTTAAKSDSGMAITESGGDVYVGGYYTGASVTVYNSTGAVGTTLLNIANGSSMFIAKYTSTGDVTWATRITASATISLLGINSILNGLSIVGGILYVTGVYAFGTVSVYNVGGVLPVFTKTTLNLNDSFVIAYNASGFSQWCNTVTGVPGANYGYGIAGPVTVGAYTSSPLSIEQVGGLPLTMTNAGLADAYIIKYTPAGAVSWRTRVAGIRVEASTAITTVGTGTYVVGIYNSI